MSVNTSQAVPDTAGTPLVVWSFASHITIRDGAVITIQRVRQHHTRADPSRVCAALADWGTAVVTRPAPDVALAALTHSGVPAVARRGRLTLVGDIHLAGRVELGRSLGLDAHAARHAPDVALAAQALERWGSSAVDRLLGAFAIIVWDAASRQLTLLRDHLGQRPLCYCATPAAVVVASDPEAVLAHPGVPRGLDVDAVVAPFVEYHAIALERTPWRAVVKVPPACFVTIDADGHVRRHRYWKPTRRGSLELAQPRDAAGALREAVARATADATHGEEMVGAHLSGGIDSASVAILAHEALRRDGRSLHALYSWSAPPPAAEPLSDERARVHAVAEQLATPVRWLELRASTVRAHAESELRLAPTSSALLEREVVSRAAGDGVRVLLSGWGGDEVASFNGRDHLAELARHGHWLRVSREAVAIARREGATGHELPSAALRQLRARAVVPVVRERLGRPHAELELERRIRIEYGLDWSDLHPRAAMLRREALRHLAPDAARVPMQLTLLGCGHLTARMEAWAQLGAPHGLVHRFPLLDRRVLDLCLELPGEFWLRDGWRRRIFREAMESVLPRGLAWADVKDENHVGAHVGRFANVRLEVAVGAAAEDQLIASLLAARERRARAIAAVSRPDANARRLRRFRSRDQEEPLFNQAWRIIAERPKRHL